jgi:hypothetical protein
MKGGEQTTSLFSVLRRLSSVVRHLHGLLSLMSIEVSSPLTAKSL